MGTAWAFVTLDTRPSPLASGSPSTPFFVPAPVGVICAVGGEIRWPCSTSSSIEAGTSREFLVRGYYLSSAAAPSRSGIGIIREPVPVNSLIKKPFLHWPGCHLFCEMSGSGGSASIIGC